jgi:hypothetical protein
MKRHDPVMLQWTKDFIERMLGRRPACLITHIRKNNRTEGTELVTACYRLNRTRPQVTQLHACFMTQLQFLKNDDNSSYNDSYSSQKRA